MNRRRREQSGTPETAKGRIDLGILASASRRDTARGVKNNSPAKGLAARAPRREGGGVASWKYRERGYGGARRGSTHLNLLGDHGSLWPAYRLRAPLARPPPRRGPLHVCSSACTVHFDPLIATVLFTFRRSSIVRTRVARLIQKVVLHALPSPFLYNKPAKAPLRLELLRKQVTP